MTDCVVSCLQQTAEIASPAISNGLMALAGSLGGGSLIGFTSGYFLKKMAKIALFVIGAFSLVLMYLGYTGVFTVNWDKTERGIREVSQNAINEVVKMVQHTANQFNDGNGVFGNDMIVGGAVSGFVPSFLIGLKKG